jgi:hypothetical protein
MDKQYEDLCEKSKAVLQRVRETDKALKECMKIEPDDFNHEVMRQLSVAINRSLWHLTRGQEGTESRLSLQLIDRGDKSKPWNQKNESGEGPGDICCMRSCGGVCYEHNPESYRSRQKSSH